MERVASEAPRCRRIQSHNQGWSRDNASAPQIDEPKVDTVVLPVRFQWWMMFATAASFPVIEELLCIPFVNARDRQVSMGDPMEKLFRCPHPVEPLSRNQGL
jgi:hypothetical protein